MATRAERTACLYCAGFGTVYDDDGPVMCNFCEGEGWVWESSDDLDPWYDEDIPLPVDDEEE